MSTFDNGIFNYTIIDVSNVVLNFLTDRSTDPYPSIIDMIIPNIVSYESNDYFVMRIGANAFTGNTNLVGTLIIPDSVMVIDNNAFQNCVGLSGLLTIGFGITTIGIGAFQNCSGLFGTLVILDSNVTIGNNAFQNCPGIILEKPEYNIPIQNIVFTPPLENHTYTNILFVNYLVKDYQILIDSVNTSTFPIVYTNVSTKISILELLTKYFSSISRIALAFHSSSDEETLFIDNQSFFSNTQVLNENTQFIIDLIKQFNVQNIDFLACNTFINPIWKKYYDILSTETNVIVGASDNDTGNLKYGGPIRKQ